MPQALKDEAAKKRTTLLIHQVQPGRDEQATILQMFALDHATAPMTLYTARWVSARNTEGFALWSFIHHDGQFYYLGKLWGLEDPPPTDPAHRAMRELPLQKVRELLQNNPTLLTNAIRERVKKQ